MSLLLKPCIYIYIFFFPSFFTDAPRNAPRISGYTNNQILYQGDPLTLTCDVTGGDPRVTSVTLTCMRHSQGPSNGQSSSLRVTSLRAGDHGDVCTCSGQWVRQGYYTLTDTRTLIVYCEY